MSVSPRQLFLVAGILFLAVLLWPGRDSSAVAQARALVGDDQVLMFSATWCGYCKRLRADLTRAGIDFTELDIEVSTVNNRAWRLLGGRAVPFTLVGERVVSGYAPDRIRQMAAAP
ncbi:MAG: glutaredoxin family protein [Xanthomonadales bacterium]|nr:glutaredoxin family protein [Xanthomonadales bacterium]